MFQKTDLSEILSKSAAKIYFVGIGGIAMSATAGLARAYGYEVLGSDSAEAYSPAKDVLDKYKIPYSVGYNAKNIEQAGADVYVLSSGEGEQNPEVKYLSEHNLPHFSFAELLYELTKDKLRAVVAGTNGKSTTAGLLGHLLKEIDDSSFMVGAVLQNYGSNFYKGDGHYFVFEGDEYKSQYDDPTPKFHYYKPDILVLTNIEFDHPDMYENLEAIMAEFDELIQAMPEDGLIVYNADDANVSKLVHKSNVTSVSFGIDNPADIRVEHIGSAGELTTFEISNKFSSDMAGQALGLTEDYKIQLPGKINVYNALAAVAAMRVLGFQYDQLAISVLAYRGVKRRFEKVGVKNGITIIDDYAHHPTAVSFTLKAARERYPDRKIWAVFEPHTFSRTKATLPELAQSFGDADEVLISEIYPAREKASDATITSKEVVDAIKTNRSVPLPRGEGDNIRLVRSKQEALDILKSGAKPGDIIIVMAVGSFNRLAYGLKDIL